MSRLGSYLAEEGILSPSDRQMIRRESAGHHGSFARSILSMGLLDEEELSALLAAKTSFRRAAKNILHEMDPTIAGTLPNHILAWLEVLPLAVKDGVISVAVLDPTDHDTINQIKFFTGLRVRPVIATHSEILRGLKELGVSPHHDESHLETFIKNHIGASTATSPRNEASQQWANQSDPRRVVARDVASEELGIRLVQTDHPSIELSPSAGLSQDQHLAEDVLVEDEHLENEHVENEMAEAAKSDVDVLTNHLDEIQDSLSVESGPSLLEPETGDAEEIQDVTPAVHSAISSLNRVLLKLQMSGSAEDALQNLAKVAFKIGVRSGAVLTMSPEAKHPGLVWGDSGGAFHSSFELPAGLDVSLMSELAEAHTDEEKWVSLEKILGDQLEVFINYWVEDSCAPNKAFIWRKGASPLICLAAVSGEIDHDGVLQSLADVVRAVSAHL